MQGQVVRVISGFFDIVVENKEYRVRAAGKLRNEKISPLVGDFVIFKKNGFLTKVLPRKNFLIRPKVANVDQVIIVQSLKNPEFSSFLLNKFLAIVEIAKIKPVILFTKKDLSIISPKDEYINDGYEVYEIDNTNTKSLHKLAKIFKEKLSVFTGQTGVGKSTTINNLAKTNFKTQEISKALGRGKHTTRVVHVIPWLDGRLIDTPGFSSLEFNMTKLQLSKSYHDFKLASLNCEFINNCLHDKEKNCGVKKNVFEKKISKQRYSDYLRLLKEAK